MIATFFQCEPTAADRERWRAELAATPSATRRDERLMLFLFRVGGECFGIEPAHVEFIAPMPAIHSMPHRGTALAGVVNVRGAVTLCFSLASILGCAAGPATTTHPMLLVLALRGWRVACRVDAAAGVEGFPPAAKLPAPATLHAAGRTHLKGLFPSAAGRDVGWLDANSLFDAFHAAAG
ncbi:MAG: chemotaxis protein CheW [Verrucomicrobiota bacterium]